MRIVFASLGSLGDLHPLLAVARAAESRGHATVVAASGVYRGYIEGLGFTFRRIRPDFPHDPDLIGHLFHPRRGPERLMTEQIFPNVRETYADLIVATEGADFLVVGELLYVAPLVAAQRGIPWANAILAPTSFLSACDPCVLAPAPGLIHLRHLGPWVHRLVFWLGRRVTQRWSAPLREFRLELGFDSGPSPVFDGKHSPVLVLAMFSKAIAEAQPDWPDAVVQTGFPFFDQPVDPDVVARLEAFLSAGDPPVVITLGSSVVHFATDFYECAVRAIQRMGCRAILLAGPNAVRRDLPTSVLRIDYAPLSAVLPRASVVVHQGGIGTCAESLRAGIPSLIVPFGFDQPDNARRLRNLGVAEVLPRNAVSENSMVRVLTKILGSPGYRECARRVRDEIRPVQEMSATLGAIEAAARCAPPSGAASQAEPNEFEECGK